MNTIRRVVLLTAIFASFIGFSTGQDESVWAKSSSGCTWKGGDSFTPPNSKDFDAGTGACVDGAGACTGGGGRIIV
jgi:hypothetical protein